MEPTENPQSALNGQPTVSNPQPVASAPVAQPKARKPWLLWLLVLILVAAAGFLGYKYKTTHDQLAATQTQLKTAQTTLLQAQQTASGAEAVSLFISKYNNATLSRSSCANDAVAMFDVHINDKFAVYRFLCAKQAQPIRIAAFKKLSNGTYEFTYGASTGTPNNLPSYIYDTEPNFFGPTYGAKRF